MDRTQKWMGSVGCLGQIENIKRQSLFIAIKSLSYFDDAESDPMPEMLETISWPYIKETIVNTLRSFLSCC